MLWSETSSSDHPRYGQYDYSIVDVYVPFTSSSLHMCLVRASLKGDRKRRVEIAGEDVEMLLGKDPPNAMEAWRSLKRWYKAAVNGAPPPARDTLERITAEQVDLYSYVPSPGENIPVTVTPVEVDDSVPTEDEIEEAVKNLRRNRSGGTSGMQADHLKGWLAASNRVKQTAEKVEEKTDGEEEGGEHWEKLVDLVQTDSWEGGVAEETTWHTMVLIPKGRK